MEDRRPAYKGIKGERFEWLHFHCVSCNWEASLRVSKWDDVVKRLSEWYKAHAFDQGCTPFGLLHVDRRYDAVEGGDLDVG